MGSVEDWVVEPKFRVKFEARNKIQNLWPTWAYLGLQGQEFGEYLCDGGY